MNSGALDRVLKINISFFIYTNPSEEEEEKGSPEAEVWSTTTALSVLVVIVVFVDNSFSRKSRKKKTILLGTTHIPSFFLLQVEVALFVHVVRVRAHTIQR